MNKIDLSKATMAELVAFFNANAPEGTPQVKRFASVAKARERCAKLQPATPKATKTPKPEAPKRSRSDGVRDTWGDQSVREKRCERHGVRVDGQEFRSVAHAFRELKLPMKDHIRFRMELKTAGRLDRYGRVWFTMKTNG